MFRVKHSPIIRSSIKLYLQHLVLTNRVWPAVIVDESELYKSVFLLELLWDENITYTLNGKIHPSSGARLNCIYSIWCRQTECGLPSSWMSRNCVILLELFWDENITYTLNGKNEVSDLYTLLVWSLAPYTASLMVNICNPIFTKDKIINFDFPTAEKREYRNAWNKSVLCEAISDV
jgi:hypothetical protein